MANNPFRTGSSIRYGIEVYGVTGFRVDDKGIREIMDGLRHACTDLIEGIDQSKEEYGPFYGEDGMDHTTIFVEPASVGEAVRRIHEAGYATDEDEDEDPEEDRDFTEIFDDGE